MGKKVKWRHARRGRGNGEQTGAGKIKAEGGRRRNSIYWKQTLVQLTNGGWLNCNWE